MRKEKIKRGIWHLGSFLLLGVLLYSCLQDDWMTNSGRKKNGVIKGKNHDLTVAVARNWYESINQTPMVTTRSAVTNFELVSKLDWKRAIENRKGDFEVVEVPLLSRKGTMLMDRETSEKFSSEADRKKIRNVFRMVIIKNIRTGDMTHFVMYIVGTYDYLKKVKRINKNSYLYRDPHLSGSVYFYSPEGNLVNGWKYEDGKIVGSIHQGTEEGMKMQADAKTRSGYDCYMDYVIVTTNECDGFGYEDPEYGAGGGIECTEIEEWELQEVCLPNEGDEDYDYSEWYTPPSGGGSGGTGGGGNGGGGYQPAPVAPKAKAIFRNSGMTETNWMWIENMLNKIMADCMGKALYNGLKNSLKGKTLIIKFTDKEHAGFTPNGDKSGINLGMTITESNVFFHEMWHAYQAYQESESAYMNSLVNQEIEAHYAQYLYLRKLPEYKGSKWENYYAKDLRMGTIADLSDYINEKGNLHSGINVDVFNFHILSVASIFETTKGYDDPNFYKYDETRSGLSNFSNLRTLTKDC